MGLKILFCSKSFPGAPETVRRHLPDDEIVNCPQDEAYRLGLEADVLIPLMHRLEPELISETKARLIQQFGVGLEGVDIRAATKRGIQVCNVPSDVTPNAESTAEHAVFLMLGAARRIHGCLGAFEQGVWGAPVGDALFGNTALIVGLGKVGKSLTRKLKGLGMKVEAIRRTPDPHTENELGLDRVGSPENLLEIAATADFVISTVVLNDQTQGWFNSLLFRKMKPTAFVINVSRGPVINEDDLLLALREHEIAGAGLDVFTQEPLDPQSPILEMQNVFATPHVGGVTRQNHDQVGRIVAENIIRFKEGTTPLYCVNLD